MEDYKFLFKVVLIGEAGVGKGCFFIVADVIDKFNKVVWTDVIRFFRNINKMQLLKSDSWHDAYSFFKKKFNLNNLRFEIQHWLQIFISTILKIKVFLDF